MPNRQLQRHYYGMLRCHERTGDFGVIFIAVAIFSMLSGGFYKYFDMSGRVREESGLGWSLPKFHRFPSDMWSQMQVYFALSWRESHSRWEREILRGVPPSSARISFSTCTLVCGRRWRCSRVVIPTFHHRRREQANI
ncbi:hypothetical protein V7S43_012198 [Phytophthora oleae]|uniref:Uncharacterized protein n=1 Tax=Phytophthora oleae TaxID=2107226 RepID=A0ABD3F8J6_9STRA